MIQLPVPLTTVCPQSTEAASQSPLALSVSKEEAKEEKDKKAGEEEQSELPSVLGEDGEPPMVLEVNFPPFWKMTAKLQQCGSTMVDVLRCGMRSGNILWRRKKDSKDLAVWEEQGKHPAA